VPRRAASAAPWPVEERSRGSRSRGRPRQSASARKGRADRVPAPRARGL